MVFKETSIYRQTDNKCRHITKRPFVYRHNHWPLVRHWTPYFKVVTVVHHWIINAHTTKRISIQQMTITRCSAVLLVRTTSVNNSCKSCRQSVLMHRCCCFEWHNPLMIISNSRQMVRQSQWVTGTNEKGKRRVHGKRRRRWALANQSTTMSAFTDWLWSTVVA